MIKTRIGAAVWRFFRGADIGGYAISLLNRIVFFSIP